MQYRKLMSWARKLTVLLVIIATVYALGASTPHEALATSQERTTEPSLFLLNGDPN